MQVSSIHCFIRCFIHSFLHSFLHSFTHSLTQSVNQSLAHSFTYLTHLDSARLRSTPPQSGQVKSSQVKSPAKCSLTHLLTYSPDPHPFTHSPIHPLTRMDLFTHPVHSSKHSFMSLVHLGSFTSSITLTHALVLLTHSFTQPRVQSPSRPCTPSSIHSFFIHPFDQLSLRLSTDSLCHEVTHLSTRIFIHPAATSEMSSGHTLRPRIVEQAQRWERPKNFWVQDVQTCNRCDFAGPCPYVTDNNLENRSGNDECSCSPVASICRRPSSSNKLAEPPEIVPD